MTARAISYAENALEVHKVYLEVLARQDELDDDSTALTQAHNRRRGFEEYIADEEARLLASLRSKHPEMSATALEARFKIERREDERLEDARQKLLEAKFTCDIFEARVRVSESAIRIAVARMTELGGYLTYLASVKYIAETTSTTETAETAKTE